MMKKNNVKEIELELPNGFHDAKLTNVTINYMNHTVIFEVEVNWGNWHASVGEDNSFRKGRLLISKLLYCAIDPPDISYPFDKVNDLWIAGSDAITKENPVVKLPGEIPADAFAHSFFINDWNSFIYFSAREASFEWLE